MGLEGRGDFWYPHRGKKVTKKRSRVVVVYSMQPVLKVYRTKATKTKAPKVVLGVVQQVRVAMAARNRLASLAGFLLGGLVPLATYWVAHFEMTGAALYAQLSTYLVLGGLVYSAKTVYDWGSLAFKLPIKAVGFVVLLEGVMVTAKTPWLGVVALVYLIVINGVATACTLAKR